jgi:ubiquinone/menaquinone biosynthesis C-methylase UbiE
MYKKMSEKMETKGESEYRDEMLDALKGRVIEVGSGNGMNFRHYSASVTEVVAVEPEPNMRRYAEEEASKVSLPITVVAGVAQGLPFEDAEFDAGVVSLVLCSVPSQQDALAEIKRVLRPGGELRFFEHVISHHPFKAGLQRVADATFWPRVAGGCHAARDTRSAIEASGFEVDHIRRFAYRASAILPKVDHILGVARRS